MGGVLEVAREETSHSSILNSRLMLSFDSYNCRLPPSPQMMSKLWQETKAMLKSGFLNSTNFNSYQPIQHHSSGSGQDKTSVSEFPWHISINHHSSGFVTNEMNLQLSEMIILWSMAGSILKFHCHLPISIFHSPIQFHVLPSIIASDMINDKSFLLPLIK